MPGLQDVVPQQVFPLVVQKGCEQSVQHCLPDGQLPLPQHVLPLVMQKELEQQLWVFLQAVLPQHVLPLVVTKELEPLPQHVWLLELQLKFPQHVDPLGAQKFLGDPEQQVAPLGQGGLQDENDEFAADWALTDLTPRLSKKPPARAVEKSLSTLLRGRGLARFRARSSKR